MLNLSEKVQRYFYHPVHNGTLDINQPNVHKSEVLTPDGYTHLQLFVEIHNGMINNIKFKALGCPSAIACLEFIAEYLSGKNITVCQQITAEFLITELGLAKEKYGIAGLAEDLVKRV